MNLSLAAPVPRQQLSECDRDCMACKAAHIYYLTFNRKSCLTSSFEKMAFLYFFRRLQIFWLDWDWSSTRLSSLPASRDAIPEGTEPGWCPWVVQPAALPSCHHQMTDALLAFSWSWAWRKFWAWWYYLQQYQAIYVENFLCLPKNIWLQNRRSHLWVTAFLSMFQLGPSKN